jgi:hypothetical protein
MLPVKYTLVGGVLVEIDYGNIMVSILEAMHGTGKVVVANANGKEFIAMLLVFGLGILSRTTRVIGMHQLAQIVGKQFLVNLIHVLL